jgi:hypothetical protein
MLATRGLGIKLFDKSHQGDYAEYDNEDCYYLHTPANLILSAHSFLSRPATGPHPVAELLSEAGWALQPSVFQELPVLS